MSRSILQETVTSWHRHDISRHAAVVSFFMLLSVAPMLLIISGVAGLFIDSTIVERETFENLAYAIGAEGAELIFSMLAGLKNSPHSLTATVIGALILLYAATHVLAQLRISLNRIFGVELKPGDLLHHFVIRKAISLGLISLFGILFAVSVIFTTATNTFLGSMSGTIPMISVLLPLMDAAASFLLMTVLFALLMKYLPDAKIRWTEVVVGSLFTGMIFALCKTLIALYLRHTNVASAYGAAGSVIAVMLWVYFSAQIFFFGAEFTRALSLALGDKITPKDHAYTIREESGFFNRLIVWLRSLFR